MLYSWVRSFRSNWKEGLVKIGAFVCFYSLFLGLINRFANRCQLTRTAEGKVGFPFVKKRWPQNFQILVYHRVNNDYDSFFPATPIRVFEKQMEYLAVRFHVCSLEDAVEMMRRNTIPENTVVITFDDGYRDVYLYAFPVLKKLSIPATVFLATDSIESRRVLWHDRIFSAFRETQNTLLKWNGQTYPLGTLEEKLSAQRAVLRFLRSLDNHDRLCWTEQLIEKLRVEDRKELPGLMLTWDDIKIMRQSGVAFGSHTVTHPILSRLSNDNAREEIYESKRIIEEQLGRPVKTFAYPNGGWQDFTADTKALLKEAGYTCALTTIFGANADGQDIFELRRGGPWDEYLPLFATKLTWYKFCL